MRRISTTMVLLALVVGTAAAQESAFRFASDPFVGQEVTDATLESSSVETSDSASYDSYETAPAQSLLQQRAMHRAEQRQLRIDSRRWYGFSQSRPMVYADPFMTHYTPFWVGRTYRPQQNWYRAWY